ncbi:nitroreductase family deazaflavin-dependent oxidoreductase [Candidatus Gracilibacteria bacterium]|nr:nitroreductase family deazaflavin-dependent oxidoreductase [Candidatus Gracilibacteria bacterium]
MTQTTAQNKPSAGWRLFMKLQNPFMKWLLRSPFHVVVSRMYLLLTFTGRKSGKVYSTPVQYACEGSMVYIVTSQGYTWWKNLRGGVAVELRLRGKPVQGCADIADDAPTVSALMEKIYPGLNTAQRAHFVPGKVAITITLQDEKEL